jgi:hypothetical protein
MFRWGFLPVLVLVRLPSLRPLRALAIEQPVLSQPCCYACFVTRIEVCDERRELPGCPTDAADWTLPKVFEGVDSEAGVRVVIVMALWVHAGPK